MTEPEKKRRRLWIKKPIVSRKERRIWNRVGKKLDAIEAITEPEGNKCFTKTVCGLTVTKEYSEETQEALASQKSELIKKAVEIIRREPTVVMDSSSFESRIIKRIEAI